MKYALVDGQRHEAETGLRGFCQACGSLMTAKCGRQRIRHWAHRTANCDKWWERETSWHRDWKNEFPQECQEVRIEGPGGDIHIADVRTADGTVLEFQHSHLPAVERQCREAFYNPMAWIVDGMRNGKDVTTFSDFLSHSSYYHDEMWGWGLPLRPIRLVDNWVASAHPVYLDFSDTIFPDLGLSAVGFLWRIRMARTYRIVVTPFSKQNVIDHYKLGTPLQDFDRQPKPYGLRKYRSLE